MRTIILGVGTQKAATTWLFKHLINADNFSSGLMKEYHLFDALHLGSPANHVDAITRRLNNYAPNHETPHKLADNIQLMQDFYRDPERY